MLSADREDLAYETAHRVVVAQIVVLSPEDAPPTHKEFVLLTVERGERVKAEAELVRPTGGAHLFAFDSLEDIDDALERARNIADPVGLTIYLKINR